MMLRRAKSLVISSLAIAFWHTSAFAGQLSDQGRLLYAAGQYEKAGAYFAAEIKANPNDATANYLLGNVYVKLNRTAEAIAAYQKAIAIEPNGTLGGYCHQAIDALNGSSRAPSTKEKAPAVVSEPTNAEPDEKPDPNEARLTSEYKAHVNLIQERADQKIRALRGEMNERIEANGEKRMISLGPDVTTTRYDPTAANDSIKEEMEPQIKSIEDDAKRQIAAVTLAYKARLASYQSASGKPVRTPGKSAGSKSF